MTDRIIPIFPHLSPHEDKPSKTTRAIRIGCTLAAILFLGFYEIRAFYITHIAPPANISILQEFQGSYCCTCEDMNNYFAVKKGITITAHPFLLPIPEFSLQPFSISMPLEPPDGNFTQTNSAQMAAFHMYPAAYQPDVGYFYASEKAFTLITDYERVTLMPIRWGKMRFLVEPERISDFCRGPVISSQCYYSQGMKSLKGDPVYLDGTPVCQE